MSDDGFDLPNLNHEDDLDLQNLNQEFLAIVNSDIEPKIDIDQFSSIRGNIIDGPRVVAEHSMCNICLSEGGTYHLNCGHLFHPSCVLT